MRKLLWIVPALFAASPVMAISRYQSQSISCAAARQAVLSESAVIFRYPSRRVAGMTLYDRYVRDNRQCDPHEYAARAYIPTKDEARCPVLACEPLPEDSFGGLRRPWIPF
jgi:hypothetical protein